MYIYIYIFGFINHIHHFSTYSFHTPSLTLLHLQSQHPITTTPSCPSPRLSHTNLIASYTTGRWQSHVGTFSPSFFGQTLLPSTSLCFSLVMTYGLIRIFTLSTHDLRLALPLSFDKKKKKLSWRVLGLVSHKCAYWVTPERHLNAIFCVHTSKGLSSPYFYSLFSPSNLSLSLVFCGGLGTRFALLYKSVRHINVRRGVDLSEALGKVTN